MSSLSPIRLKAILDASDVVDNLDHAGGIHVDFRVRLRLFDALGTIAIGDDGGTVTLRTTLPEGTGEFELTRQGNDLASRWARLSEQKLGVADLDDAFIVRCDDDGFALLRRCEGKLRALLPCPQHGTIHLVGNTLTATWGADRIDALAHLWERLHSERIG